MDIVDGSNQIFNENGAAVVVSFPQSWREIIAIEPRIAGIVTQAAAQRGSRIRRYESAKRRLLPLVGWHAARPALQTSEAYELAMIELARRVGI